MSQVTFLDDARYPGPSIHEASAEIAGLPTQDELDAYPRMYTWGELKEVIVSGQLEKLMRNKEMQVRYNIWMNGIREKYGSTGDFESTSRIALNAYPRNTRSGSICLCELTLYIHGIENYLKQGRLPFPQSAAEPTYEPNGSSSSIPHDYLTYDAGKGFDESKYAVLTNDWPYNVPYGVRHLCVWSKLPIAHRSLVNDDPASWTKIAEEGLGGFTGVIPFTPAEKPAQTATNGTTPPHPFGWGATQLSDYQSDSWLAVDLMFGGKEMREWAGKQYTSKGGQEVQKMVEALWDVRGWECLWFVNPPRIQSVPGLSHFHVFARRKTPEEIDAAEMIWGKGDKPEHQ
ncbi:hypothetical protein L486_08536 [Kwoniella mangroviensis CBS 10435]|uniref:Uncharacterized protein n=1 Tax=Kwoniella mangroviensis CBS 10435 TaxID=1331196 RepID=A0A1B9IEB6_9TREE|nr:hypothetical protein L486_08536 [Kwoniella mangroviensis CBS 10435]